MITGRLRSDNRQTHPPASEYWIALRHSSLGRRCKLNNQSNRRRRRRCYAFAVMTAASIGSDRIPIRQVDKRLLFDREVYLLQSEIAIQITTGHLLNVRSRLLSFRIESCDRSDDYSRVFYDCAPSVFELTPHPLTCGSSDSRARTLSLTTGLDRNLARERQICAAEPKQMISCKSGGAATIQKATHDGDHNELLAGSGTSAA